MSDTTATASWPAGDRRFAGVTRILLGFVIGALFGLLPMYYFYMGREAALRAGGTRSDTAFADAPGFAVEPAIATSATKPFASRLTYELSRLPDERPAPPPKTAAATPVVAARTVSSPPPQALATERVIDARPIGAVAPDSREHTEDIQRQAQNADSRSAAGAQVKAPAPPAGRVFEGRDVELKALRLPDTPTRPIVAGAAGNMRAEIEAERALQLAPGQAVKPIAPVAANATKTAKPVSPSGPPIAGVTPITRGEPVAVATAAGSADAAPASPRDGIEARLAATREWLAGAAPATHTIQLMGTNSEAHLKSRLQALGKVLEPGKLYVFRTKAQGKPSVSVVYGAYSDRKSALQALEKLPPSLAANKPVLRTVNGIRAEMKQHGTDGTL